MSGPLAIEHAAMTDALDTAGIHKALSRLDFPTPFKFERAGAANPGRFRQNARLRATA